MKKTKYIIGLGLVSIILASCSVSGPLFVTSNTIGKKTGVASRTLFLGITLGTTDLSIQTAAKNGGITKIATVDTKVEGGLFTSTYSTIVTGE
jgi:hypothetical protein